MKRFTETQKWEDAWFRKLPLEQKALWWWLLDKCDNAGVIEPDIELASFQIGYEYPMDTLSVFGERVVNIGHGKWFIPKFIEFQYGTLSPDCKAHNPVFASLKKHGLEGYAKGIQPLQEKEKDKEKEEDIEKDSSARDPWTPLAKIIWDGCPKQGRERSSKKELMEALKKIPKKDLPTADMAANAIACWSASRKWTEEDGKWIQGIHRWAAQRQWENLPDPATAKRPTDPPTVDPGIRGQHETVFKLSELVKKRQQQDQ